MLKFLPLCLSLAFGVMPLAQAKVTVTEVEKAAIDRAEARGRLIWFFDRAAWVSTDTLMTQVEKLKGVDLSSGGWVVEIKGPRFVVTYYADATGKPVPIYVAEVEGERVVADHLVTRADAEPMTPAQLRMAAARKAAMQAPEQPCTPGNFNTIVVPPEPGAATTEVYLLSPQVEEGAYPVGGHFLVEVADDGRIVTSRPFMKSCMMANPTKQTPSGSGSVGFMVTHLLDPTPTEIHVFLSIWMDMPLYVGAGDRVWAVEKDEIRLVDR